MQPPARRFLLWLVIVALLLGLGGGVALPQLKIETDITEMLPRTAPDATTELALERFSAAAGQRVLFLIEADRFDTARAASSAFASVIGTSPAISAVDFERQIDQAALDAVLLPSRHRLLAAADRAALAEDDAQALADAALRALYTPAGLMRLLPLGQDPLNLYGHFLGEISAAPGHLQLRRGVLTVQNGSRHGVLVTVTLAASPFALGAQASAQGAIETASRAAQAVDPGVTLQQSGVLQHAQANSERAKREIGVFGSLSLIGVVLVFLYCFSSLRPLLLVMMTLGLGTAASVIAVQLLFGEVHLLALVFGSSLIGVAVDYAIHFFADRFRSDGHWSGQIAVRHVGVAIVVGMITSSLGYLAMVAPPFPGLRQMSVFSVVGVLTAGLTTLLAYPLLAGGSARPAPQGLALAAARLGRLRLHGGTGITIALGLASLCLLGLWRLQFVDDVRTLQSSPPELIAREADMRERLGGGTDTRFFLIQAADSEGVLQREEALRGHLDALVADAELGGYLALSRAVPSQQRQTQNHRWLAEQVYAPDGAAFRLLNAVGADAETTDTLKNAWQSDGNQPLTAETWLSQPAGEAYRNLWLGETGHGVASVVALFGVTDVAALNRAGQGIDGVRLIDRVADISAVLAHYRRICLIGLGVALAAVAAVVALRYGWRATPRLILAPLGGCLLTLATLGLLGLPANLFTVLALLLVLGLGIDYTVFLREAGTERNVAIMAITAAALTTTLAFGMLSGSATPFIHSLGLAALLGIVYTWLLALLASAGPTRRVPE